MQQVFSKNEKNYQPFLYFSINHVMILLRHENEKGLDHGKKKGGEFF